MTNQYHRRDTLHASEESSCWPLPGSSFYCHPQEVFHWQENVPHPVDISQSQNFYPSPPESDYYYQDCQDMMAQHSQTSVSSPDNAQCYQSSWQGQSAPVTAQRIAALDIASSYLSVPPSTVSSVLSPVLSHESQSQDTLTTFSEPDLCELPAALDLSFTTEPGWNYASPAQYSSADVPSSVSGFGFTPLSGQSPYSLGCAMAPASAMVSGTNGPIFFPQGGQVACQKRSASYPHVAPMREIRPRTDGSTASSQSVLEQQQAERPQMPASHGSQHTVSSVSSSSGQSTNISQYASCGYSGPVQTVTSMPLMPYGHAGYGAPASLVPDPTDEDFSAFLHYDHEDHAASNGALSFATSYGLPSNVPSGVEEEVKPIVPVIQQTRKAASQASSAPTSHTGENDEGRHRTHHLYSRGPESDGLYHCPYKAKDPNCPHKPTKLKCNYDKFIDSHLKPFRCKVESCAKQEFSSTACLLRHEREAHGMHGHGERPHLCHYSGCERSAPGNGFPRRYNLFDHMKRVHDHKEDLADPTGSPFSGADGQKKAGSRKRKPSNSPPAPAPQRPKATPVTSQHAAAMYYPTAGYIPQSIYDTTQWTNQTPMMARPVDFGHGQNAELRRMSAHAQRR